MNIADNMPIFFLLNFIMLQKYPLELQNLISENVKEMLISDLFGQKIRHRFALSLASRPTYVGSYGLSVQHHC